MRRLIFLFAALSLLTLNRADAQTSAWEILIYDADVEQIQAIGVDGEIARSSVPRSPEGYLLTPRQISSDRRWVAGVLSIYDIQFNRVMQSALMPEGEFAYMEGVSTWTDQGVTFTTAPSFPMEFLVNGYLKILECIGKSE